MRIKYSKDALVEMDAIYEHICDKFGYRVADTKTASLKADIKRLESDPFMGKSCDGHDENFRQIFFKPNIVIYDINDEVIEILHVVDARTDYVKNIL